MLVQQVFSCGCFGWHDPRPTCLCDICCDDAPCSALGSRALLTAPGPATRKPVYMSAVGLIWFMLLCRWAVFQSPAHMPWSYGHVLGSVPSDCRCWCDLDDCLSHGTAPVYVSEGLASQHTCGNNIAALVRWHQASARPMTARHPSSCAGSPLCCISCTKEAPTGAPVICPDQHGACMCLPSTMSGVCNAILLSKEGTQALGAKPLHLRRRLMGAGDGH